MYQLWNILNIFAPTNDDYGKKFIATIGEYSEYSSGSRIC